MYDLRFLEHQECNVGIKTFRHTFQFPSSSLIFFFVAKIESPCINHRHCIYIRNKQTPLSESASELYRPSDSRLSAK
jgi:hypothetical protein